jgi:hypothetical protein
MTESEEFLRLQAILRNAIAGDLELTGDQRESLLAHGEAAIRERLIAPERALEAGDDPRNAAARAFWGKVLAAEPAIQVILDQQQRDLTAIFEDHLELKADAESERLRVAARGRNGGAAKARMGKGDLVRQRAAELLKSQPGLTRDQMADRIHKDLHLSVDTTIDHLKRDGWWSSRKSV